jgi:hypothetical protein
MAGKAFLAKSRTLLSSPSHLRPSEALREVVQGQDPRARITAAPANYVLGGLMRSGMGTIAGDYLFGEFDRHGHSPDFDRGRYDHRRARHWPGERLQGYCDCSSG